jgi:tetratricopeptide (TPR) repeat protein
MSAEASPQGHRLHLGIAEQGKVHALKGEHTRALTCYREAMRMAVAAGAPEVFFRHYMECTIELLERMGSFADVLAYCDRALAHYAGFTPADDAQRAVVRTDLAYTHQRRGVVLLKMGRTEEACAALGEALAVAREAGIRLELAEALLGWASRGLHLEPRRILMEQESRRYFSVRPDTVDPTLAIALPEVMAHV